jgi:hypothetical protein
MTFRYSRNSPFLWNQKVHCRVYKNQPPVPILNSQLTYARKNSSCWHELLVISTTDDRVGFPCTSAQLPAFLLINSEYPFKNSRFYLNMQTANFATTLVSQCLGLNKPKSLSVSAKSDNTWNRLPVDSGQDVRVQSTVPQDHLYLSLWIFGCWNTRRRCCCQLRSMTLGVSQ